MKPHPVSLGFLGQRDSWAQCIAHVHSHVRRKPFARQEERPISECLPSELRKKKPVEISVEFC